MPAVVVVMVGLGLLALAVTAVLEIADDGGVFVAVVDEMVVAVAAAAELTAGVGALDETRDSRRASSGSED